jgi:hypothetical protein
MLGPASAANATLLTLKPSEPLVGFAEIRNFGAPNQRTAYCQTANGWLGALHVFRPAGQPARALCVAHDGTNDATVGPPVRTWKPGAASLTPTAWTTNQLDARAGLILFVQPNGRAMRPCAVDDGAGTPQAKTVLGYVGDDGRCYGVAVNGFTATGTTVSFAGERKGYDSFSILLQGNPADAHLPAEGWVSVKDARLPRGVFESFGGNTACRGRRGSDMWPGYVNPTTKQCDLFTYYGGRTGRASVGDYEVFRTIRCSFGTAASRTYGTLGTADKLCTYSTPTGPATTATYNTEVISAGTRVPYSRVGNSSYWLCSGSKLTNDSTGERRSFFGFTNNPEGCTDGTNTVNLTKDRGFNPLVTVYAAPADNRG